MNRRAMLSTTALIAPLTALAACNLVTPANIAAVQSIINKIQALLPFISGIASVLGVIVPGASAIIGTVQAALSSALAVFNTITTAMTQAAAQAPVKQVATYIEAGVTSLEQAITALPATWQGAVTNIIADARLVLNDLFAFANPPATVTAQTIIGVSPSRLYIRVAQ